MIHLKDKPAAPYMGLPPRGMTPFSLAAEGRPVRAPSRPTPYRTKAQQAATSLEEPEERRARHKAAREARILRQNKDTYTPDDQASKDRTASIGGRSLPNWRKP